MPAPVTPLAVANEFVAAHGGPAGIEHMKLQKLVYCAYGWWLAVNGLGERRLTTDGPEIWKHGPVFPSLYTALRIFGRRPIQQPQSSGPFVPPERIEEEDEYERTLISWTWARYGHLSSFALSDMTHKVGTPWHRVATENQFRVNRNMRIPDEYIYEEFHGLLNQVQAAQVQDNQNNGQTAAAAN